MKRVVKSPDVRRIEIITAASKLFEKNGYEKTPVESIIKEVGIAKGTFYHYFESKKEILEAIVLQIGTEMAAYFSAIVAIENLSAIEKFQRMLRSPKKKAITDSSVMKTIHKPENRALQEQLNIQTVNIIAPLMTQVLAQGYKEGVFKKQVSVEMKLN